MKKFILKNLFIIISAFVLGLTIGLNIASYFNDSPVILWLMLAVVGIWLLTISLLALWYSRRARKLAELALKLIDSGDYALAHARLSEMLAGTYIRMEKQLLIYYLAVIELLSGDTYSGIRRLKEDFKLSDVTMMMGDIPASVVYILFLYGSITMNSEVTAYTLEHFHKLHGMLVRQAKYSPDIERQLKVIDLFREGKGSCAVELIKVGSASKLLFVKEYIDSFDSAPI